MPSTASALCLIYGINNNGYIDVCGCKNKKVRQGSITRRASFVRQMRSNHPHLLLVDGGNMLFNRDDRKVPAHEKPQLEEKAKVLVESYNRLGYRATTIGYQDFSLGFETMKKLFAPARFAVVCANLIVPSTGELVFPPHTEVEVGGTKVGIIGVTQSTLQPHYLDQYGGGTRVTDPLEAVRKSLAELRPRNDLILVLSQNAEEVNQNILKELPGIDFLIDPMFQLGSSKIWIDPPELLKPFGSGYMLRSDAQGAKLGALSLWVHRNSAQPAVNRAETPVPPEGRTSFRFQRHSMEPHLLEDPEILQLVNAFRQSTAFVNTDALPPLPRKHEFLGAATCQPCHASQYEWWQKTAHAHAFATLEKTNDQWRQDCIGCHTLGYGQAFLAPSDADPFKNVQCENCHGLNPQHATDPAAHKWPRIDELACLACHNESQTRSQFQFIASRRQVACPKLER
jgi:hypothetical protein